MTSLSRCSTLCIERRVKQRLGKIYAMRVSSQHPRTASGTNVPGIVGVTGGKAVQSDMQMNVGHALASKRERCYTVSHSKRHRVAFVVSGYTSAS
ncbi:hypothetical protein MRX96_009537 [Rhipicephalus microplus]